MLKRKEGETFGFNLRVEKGRPGHVIRKVELRGLAERSGLRDGDRVLEVNEHFVDDLEHMEVRALDTCSQQIRYNFTFTLQQFHLNDERVIAFFSFPGCPHYPDEWA